jgi:hypothetical protein
MTRAATTDPDTGEPARAADRRTDEVNQPGVIFHEFTADISGESSQA